MEENTSREGVRMQLGNRVTVEERRTETESTTRGGARMQ